MMLERTTPQSGRRWWLGKLAELSVVAVVITILIALLLPAVQQGRTSPRREICGHDLKSLGLALHAYHDMYGSFPAAFMASENEVDSPAHSWRLQLLQYLERGDIYSNYHFELPWNAEANIELGRDFAFERLFTCPSAPPRDAAKWPTTNYLAIVGNGTAWPGDRAIKLSDIKDDLSSTILLVEMADSDIAILEPRDLQFDQLPLQINPPAGKGISSHHSGGANVLMADGSVRFLPNDLPAEVLRAMLTISGGEAIDLERLQLE